MTEEHEEFEPASTRSPLLASVTRFATENARPVTAGVLTGLLAGLATFTYTQSDLFPEYPQLLALGTLFLAGCYTRAFTNDMRGSVKALTVSWVVGIGVIVAGWVGPLWYLGYAPGARDLLIPPLLNTAFSHVIFTYFFIFTAGYLTVVSLMGWFDW
jgi:hypothetical protein